jgi:hypothetical protein
MKQVALGVQEPLVVEPHLHLVGLKESDEVLNEPQRFRRERFGFQVALEPGRERLAVIGSQPHVGAGLRIGADKQPERPDLV